MQPRRPIPGSFVGPVLLRVVSSVEQEDDNSNLQNRWDYKVNFGNWNDETTLQSIDDFDAQNVWEKNNDHTVAMGISTSTLPGSYELKPCPNETFVFGYFSPVQVQWFFCWPSQFDGSC